MSHGKENAFHSDHLEVYQSGYAKGYAQGRTEAIERGDSYWPGSSIHPGEAQAGQMANEAPPRDSTLSRIEKELAEIEYNSRRAVKLAGLRDLLREHPEVARILELKAELGV